jgi:hypothetical protein
VGELERGCYGSSSSFWFKSVLPGSYASLWIWVGYQTHRTQGYGKDGVGGVPFLLCGPPPLRALLRAGVMLLLLAYLDIYPWCLSFLFLCFLLVAVLLCPEGVGR